MPGKPEYYQKGTDCTEVSGELYTLLFPDYPDVVAVDDLCRMLGGIGRKSAYALLRENKIGSIKVGRSYRIPKVNIIRYLKLDL